MKTSTKVIIRSFGSGVHFGTLERREGDTVTLTDARRVYRWQIDYKTHKTSQVTCSELAQFGPWGDSRIAVPVSEIDISGVVEVIACTDAAAAAIEGWPT